LRSAVGADDFVLFEEHVVCVTAFLAPSSCGLFGFRGRGVLKQRQVYLTHVRDMAERAHSGEEERGHLLIDAAVMFRPFQLLRGGWERKTAAKAKKKP
jgi:hypothetical protein